MWHPNSRRVDTDLATPHQVLRAGEMLSSAALRSWDVDEERQRGARYFTCGETVMKRSLSYLAGTLLLAACAQTPMGPTVPVMPGPNTSFSQFQNDQAVCREFAEQAVRDQAQGANLRGLGTAALTTALGAGLGAAIGGGQGAGIGAAAGALGGTGLAARNTSNANTSIQTQYNNAFAACMFSLGNSVPSMGPMMSR
jgi:outer membrane lipoprotein SlyB